MATIVLHERTNTRYVLLGAGFGAYQSKKPNWFLGDWVADTTEGQFAMVCVARKDGSIGWLKSSEVTVESVDGHTVRDLLTSDDDADE